MLLSYLGNQKQIDIFYNAKLITLLYNLDIVYESNFFYFGVNLSLSQILSTLSLWRARITKQSA